MNRNFIWILLIFLVPLGVYYGLTRDKLTTPPSIAANCAEVIKFSSPMCFECQELEKVFNEVFPSFKKDIVYTEIDVTNRDKNTQALIKQYEVQLVPTTVSKKNDGTIKRKIEGSMQPKILENYLKELVNE